MLVWVAGGSPWSCSWRSFCSRISSPSTALTATQLSIQSAAPDGTRARSRVPLALGAIVDSRLPQVSGKALARHASWGSGASMSLPELRLFGRHCGAYVALKAYANKCVNNSEYYA
jgi:hypothetical protein